MHPTAFIPKDDQELPDAYGMKVFYLDGKSEEFEVAQHQLHDSLLSLITKEDTVHWVPLGSVKRVEYDKRFSKVLAVRQKQEQEAMEAMRAKQEEALKAKQEK